MSAMFYTKESHTNRKFIAIPIVIALVAAIVASCIIFIPGIVNKSSLTGSWYMHNFNEADPDIKSIIEEPTFTKMDFNKDGTGKWYVSVCTGLDEIDSATTMPFTWSIENGKDYGIDNARIAVITYTVYSFSKTIIYRITNGDDSIIFKTIGTYDEATKTIGESSWSSFILAES